MKVYSVTNKAKDSEDPVEYAATLKEAQAAAKTWPKGNWPELEIAEIDVMTDKAGVIAALSGNPKFNPSGQTWSISSPRGGLVKD